MPPRCVEASLAALRDADEKRRLFDFQPFVERWRAPLCDALLGALLDGRHALLGDEAAVPPLLYAFACAAADANEDPVVTFDEAEDCLAFLRAVVAQTVVRR